jgi:cell division protein FtsA
MLDLFKPVSTKYRPQNVAVLDFGSSSVKSAIIDLTTFRPTLLGLGEEPFKSTTILSGLVSDLDDYLQTIRNSIRKASFSCGFTPRDFVFSLSGEFVKTLTVDLKIHREVSGPIRVSEQDKIIKEVGRLVDREIGLEFPKITGNPNQSFRHIERRVLSLESLTGVRLENLSSVLEQDFTATVLVSFISHQTEGLLQKVVGDIKRNLLFKTSQMSSTVSFLKKSDGNFSAVLVDFGGQVTDVCLVINGRIIGTRTLPLGGRDVTLELQDRFRISEEEAESKKVKGEFVLEDTKDLLFFWIRGVNEALSSISDGNSIYFIR